MRFNFNEADGAQRIADQCNALATIRNGGGTDVLSMYQCIH